MDELAQKAISAALSGDWALAERLNKKITQTEPDNIEALNRLARSQSELSKVKEAEATYKKVLKLDRYNQIAQKAISRLEKRKTQKTAPSPAILETTFLEEPGKTKTVSLIHLGDAQVLAELDSGEEVMLEGRRHRISVTTPNGRYIGRIPDDLSSRLIKLIKGGNKYQALVKSVDSNSVKIFIRELERCEKFKDLPSFPLSEKVGYVAFTPPELVHEELPEVKSLEEEDQS